MHLSRFANWLRLGRDPSSLHIRPNSPRGTMFFLVPLLFISEVRAFCGENIKWAHHFNIEDVYGVWHGVGYAQHTPDMTNRPNEIGCITLYILDATIGDRNDWLDWSLPRRNYTNQNWRSPKSNPYSDTAMSGSWMDLRVKRRAKRDIYTERKLSVIWDEDGQTIEQIYVYTPGAPGLWVAEKRRSGEQEMMARGIDVWYPDDPPRHPEVIRVLKVTSDMLIINHCSDMGTVGIFSLILRRSIEKLNREEWYDMQRQLYSFDLPTMQRHSAICAGCMQHSSILFVVLSLIMSLIQRWPFTNDDSIS